MFRSIMARLGPLFLIWALVLTSAPTELQFFRCQHDGKLRRACCCAEDRVRDVHPEIASDRDGCCSIEHIEFAPSGYHRSDGQEAAFAHPTPLPPSLLPLDPPRMALAAPVRRDEPPDHHGPPLFVLNRSLLI